MKNIFTVNGKSASWAGLNNNSRKVGLTHFPNHKNAAREYIEHLSGRRRKKFIRAWVEYEEQYDIVNSLGVMAPAVAIAPSEADLSKGPNAQEMIRWEIDRVDRVTESLNRLLDTARIKLLL